MRTAKECGIISDAIDSRRCEKWLQIGATWYGGQEKWLQIGSVSEPQTKKNKKFSLSLIFSTFP
jgi:hypothetical protein